TPGEGTGMVRLPSCPVMSPMMAARAPSRSPGVSAKYACCVPPATAMRSSEQHGDSSTGPVAAFCCWGSGVIAALLESVGEYGPFVMLHIPVSMFDAARAAQLALPV